MKLKVGPRNKSHGCLHNPVNRIQGMLCTEMRTHATENDAICSCKAYHSYSVNADSKGRGRYLQTGWKSQHRKGNGTNKPQHIEKKLTGFTLGINCSGISFTLKFNFFFFKYIIYSKRLCYTPMKLMKNPPNDLIPFWLSHVILPE